MKKFLTLMFLSYSLVIFSQDPKTDDQNFQLQENKKLIWVKVFETEVLKDSISRLIKNKISSLNFLNNLDYENYQFSGITRYKLLDDTKGLYGVASNTDYKCFVNIAIKDKKYRVSISEITFKDIPVSVGTTTIKNEYTLASLTTKSRGTKIKTSSLTRKTLASFNSDFIKLFEVKNNEKDEW